MLQGIVLKQGVLDKEAGQAEGCCIASAGPVAAGDHGFPHLKDYGSPHSWRPLRSKTLQLQAFQQASQVCMCMYVESALLRLTLLLQPDVTWFGILNHTRMQYVRSPVLKRVSWPLLKMGAAGQCVLICVCVACVQKMGC